MNLTLLKMNKSVFIFLLFLIPINGWFFNSLPCKCRLGNLNRIVNGKIASDNLIPWIASLGTQSNIHLCGATIINQKFVLTNSNCLINKKAEDITVRVGTNDVSKLYRNNVFNVSYIFKEFQDILNDSSGFALLELKKPIKFKDGSIEPGCFNFIDDNFSGDLLTAGWGYTEKPWKDAKGQLHLAPIKNYKLKYYFGVQTNDQCNSNDICVLGKNKEDNVCSGDGGGPLMHTVNGKTSVVGILNDVSSKLEDSKYYLCNGEASYIRVKKFLDFFRMFVGNFCDA